MKHKCPSCGKPLVSRLSPLCSYCGARLPAELLFSKAERNRIEAEELKVRNKLEESDTEKKKQQEGFYPFTAGQ